MKQWTKHIRSLKNSNEMVSDLVGTIVLLAIAVVIFSSLYGIVFSYPFATDPAKVTIIGTIEGDTIILEHRGGEALGLETTIPITIGDDKLTLTVRDLLIDNNGDGLWNIGERLVYKFNYSLTNIEADIMAIDVESNNLVLTGTLDIHPESDIGVKITVDPVVSSYTALRILRIKATNYRGDMNASNITIECKLPDGILYASHILSQGTYDSITGIWEIDRLNIAQSATLDITVNVIYTQLALLLDGSGSITSSDWTIMRNGIAMAITDGYVPHNGEVELTVIQFGGSSDPNGRIWAQVELDGPIVLDSTNYETVASQIQAIPQLGGGTAMSCAFRLAADVMSGDPNGYLAGTPFAGMASTHSDWPRQVVNLITDGKPNVIYNHSDRYGGYWAGLIGNQYVHGKLDTGAALAYYLSPELRPLGEGDEIDAEAVGTQTEIGWLRDKIVRPQPGYDTWPPAGPGWVIPVKDYNELANTIAKQFELIFNRTIIIEKVASTPLDDPNSENNKVSISIMP